MFWNEQMTRKRINEELYNLHEKAKCLGISHKINLSKQAIKHLKEVK
jgi:hypothetical protein